MFLRSFAFLALLLTGASRLPAQDARHEGLPDLRDANGSPLPLPHSAWLDLRQTAVEHSTPQNTPGWVESVTLVHAPQQADAAPRTIFRVRVSRPQIALQLLLMRVLFDDKPDQQPTITIWDESGTQVMQSKPLGAGLDLSISESVMLPMIGVSCIDIEVTGDGRNVRGAFLDWMMSRTVAHPMAAEAREVMAAPFQTTVPLQAPTRDTEMFGTVIASLAPEVIRIGASVQTGAAFQFGLESQTLMALLSFEVASAWVDSPPEIYCNGQPLGPVSITFPDLADPAYRGETARLVSPMRFRYTGWLRAQKLVPASYLKTGTNDVIVIGGPGTPASAIRATQIQLKYLWDKSDYLLDPK